jgi:uroporphyrinogen decarboxylase
MTPKENALRIIRFDRPERIVGAPWTYTLSYLGCNHEGFDGKGHDQPVGSRWTDIWGTVWHKEHAEVIGYPCGNPLDEPAKLRSYRWPDPDDERICSQVYQWHKDFPHDGRLLAGSHRDVLWEKSYMLVGMENMMVYFHTEPAFVREVLHRIMDWQLGIARHYLELGVELISCTDDLGMQLGPLIGPDMVNEFLVPEYRRLFELYRSRGVLINFHTCGKIEKFIPMFLDLGVDILNPVQATANDLDWIRAQTAGNMCLQGAVGSSIVYDGPPERIAAEARKRMWQLGRDGGYFCCPDQWLPFPPAHMEALKRAVEEYGRYPLRPAE